VHSALIVGNQRAVRAFTDHENGGGLLVGTKGLWQGVDVADANRLRLVWINKLPFAPFGAPVVEARREAVKVRAELAGAEDPDAVATETYYLPLAALQLRQAVGRLIRSERHRGVIVISDRKLAGVIALRRAYRQTFLGSLDAGLLRRDADTGEPTGGNVTTMADGWRRMWAFFARHGLLDPLRAAELSTDEALEAHTLLPQTRRIRSLALAPAEVAALRAAGRLAEEVAERAAQVAGLLHLSDDPAELKTSQLAAIGAVAEGRNLLALLPTGFGKSFCFQLPALVLPGVTIVVSPLVALMHDQALELNRSIGGAVRALVAPLRESSSRAGKTEVADQLLGRADHGIRLVYVSPERLCQRRFRELVRAAVAAGRVQRIALDEAHTFVQWGDDFRPSFRRVEQFLAELRAEFGLPVTALTATANRAVHAGLREGVFGLSADPPDGGDELVTVRENPIRPELAVFRRSLAAAGPAVVAGLAEEVLDSLDNHAIFYCLTVKEVVRLHAHLREYLGDAGVRVRRFHGRLTEAEKSAVMTEFREAPRKGDEGFAPLLVVATSAFGLGINRPDIRTVFCVSPPTDLAALYQQLGRAGRDAAARAIVGAADPDDDGVPSTPPHDGQRPANTGLALLTNRGLRTVAFMTGQDLPDPLLYRMAQAVLSCGGVLDAAWAAEQLIGEDLAAGRLTPKEAGQRRTLDTYSGGVARAFAALAGLGAVTDLGDFPPLAAVKAGELLGRHDPGDDEPSAALERAVLAALLSLPARSEDRRQLHRARLDVANADGWLAATVPGFRDLATDPPATWQLLADLHDRGELDVSAAPSRKLVTGAEVHMAAVPPGFAAAVSAKAARAAAETAMLQDFFADRGTCANSKFADYFGVDVPNACCTTAANRCSACWDFRADWPATDTQPAAATAFLIDRPRPAGWRVDAAAKARRLDEQVRMLLWLVDRGLSARDVQLALRGQDTWFYARARRWVRLPTGVVTSRFFGVNPAVTLPQVEDALARIAADGRAVAVGRRWRDAGNVAREQRRLARQAAAGAVR
jgi:RecQ family ATP-dependent DNA helicase